MTSKQTLPAKFNGLHAFLDWALPTETLRLSKRESSSLEDIREFYDAVLAEMPDIIAYLRNAASYAEADASTRTLYTLMLSFADASLSMELHKSPTVPDGMPWEIWKPEHETPSWQRKPPIALQHA